MVSIFFLLPLWERKIERNVVMTLTVFLTVLCCVRLLPRFFILHWCRTLFIIISQLQCVFNSWFSLFIRDLWLWISQSLLFAQDHWFLFFTFIVFSARIHHFFADSCFEACLLANYHLIFNKKIHTQSFTFIHEKDIIILLFLQN